MAGRLRPREDKTEGQGLDIRTSDLLRVLDDEMSRHRENEGSLGLHRPASSETNTRDTGGTSGNMQLHHQSRTLTEEEDRTQGRTSARRQPQEKGCKADADLVVLLLSLATLE